MKLGLRLPSRQSLGRARAQCAQALARAYRWGPAPRRGCAQCPSALSTRAATSGGYLTGTASCRELLTTIGISAVTRSTRRAPAARTSSSVVSVIARQWCTDFEVRTTAPWETLSSGSPQQAAHWNLRSTAETARMATRERSGTPRCRVGSVDGRPDPATGRVASVSRMQGSVVVSGRACPVLRRRRSTPRCCEH